MFHWIPYAFIRIVLFFIGGILLGIYWPDSISSSVATIALLTLAACYCILFIIRLWKNNEILNPGFTGLCVIFLAGYIHLLEQTDSRREDHLSHFAEEVAYYRAVISKYPQEKNRSWKFEARVTDVQSNGQWTSCTGNVLLYFSKESFPTPFTYGDVLLIKDSPQVLTGPQNPGEFDYKRFLTFRNINHQHFVQADGVHWIENVPPNLVMYYAIRARSWADNILKQHVSGEQEQDIASALVLGITDDIDNELLKAYSATGAMHVLSVSGLHVGIIYMIIVFLLKPVSQMRSGKWIIAGLSILILWIYAFVTGLSPSVLRAVTMFSFVAIAQPWNQRTNIYNTLAASAFCLLLYDPYMIMSVGFQLSYLAVLGIVYLQPVFYRWWEPRSRFLDEVWKITCVSLAAQIATFSLGLLYFHQFPNYFLLSNLLVIPISFGVLVSGLIVLAVSFIQPLAWLIGIVLEGLIKAMNFVVLFVEDLPFSLVSNIQISTLQCWLMMLAIVSIILLFERRRFNYIWITGGLIFGFSIVQWSHYNSAFNRTRLTVYKVSGHTAVDLIDRGKTCFISDSVLASDAERMRFHVNPNRLICGVDEVTPGDESTFVRETEYGKLISWNGRLILIRTDEGSPEPDHVKVDYLIISNNSVHDLPAFLKKVEATRIILDSSNSFYYADRLLKNFTSPGLIYSVWHQGAFDHTI